MAQTLGRYTLVRRVGAGGMAEIWKAKARGPEGFEKVIAIKRVLPALASDPEFVKMFIDEAKLAAELVHPNVVTVFDFGKGYAGEHYLAMEYVAGSNLSQITKRLADKGQRLPVECCLYVILEATRGLAYAHEKTDAMGKPLDIVHRDVSPQNILVSFGGDVKVADFGIAKLSTTTQNTTTGQIRGKLGYLAPERAELKPIHWRSDFFSLGIVLYELLTGQRMFVGQESEVLLKLVGFQAPPEDEVSKLPADVAAIVRGMLTRDPAKRLAGRELEVALVKRLGPEGALSAKKQLAECIDPVFVEEKKLETTESFGATGAGAPAVKPAVNSGTGVTKAKPLVDTKVLASENATPKTPAAPRLPSPSNPRGVPAAVTESGAGPTKVALAAVAVVVIAIVAWKMWPSPTTAATVPGGAIASGSATPAPVAGRTPEHRCAAWQAWSTAAGRCIDNCPAGQHGSFSGCVADTPVFVPSTPTATPIETAAATPAPATPVFTPAPPPPPPPPPPADAPPLGGFPPPPPGGYPPPPPGGHPPPPPPGHPPPPPPG